jgi:hypothetical protein
MAKIERTKGQRIIYKALRRKPKIKQQVYHKNTRLNPGAPEGKTVLFH